VNVCLRCEPNKRLIKVIYTIRAAISDEAYSGDYVYGYVDENVVHVNNGN
jgi:hypothetical protein